MFLPESVVIVGAELRLLHQPPTILMCKRKMTSNNGGSLCDRAVFYEDRRFGQADGLKLVQINGLILYKGGPVNMYHQA